MAPVPVNPSCSRSGAAGRGSPASGCGRPATPRGAVVVVVVGSGRGGRRVGVDEPADGAGGPVTRVRAPRPSRRRRRRAGDDGGRGGRRGRSPGRGGGRGSRRRYGCRPGRRWATISRDPPAPAPRAAPPWRRAMPSAPATRRGSPTSWDGPEPLASANPRWFGPSPTTGPPYARVTPPAPAVRRTGADGPGPGGRRGRGGRGRSGRPARRWNSRGHSGRRDLDLVGAHALPVQVDQRRVSSSRSVSVGGAPARDGSAPNGTDRPARSLARKSGAEPAADGGEEVEHGEGAVLTGPFLQDHPSGRYQLAEELVRVLPFPAPAPLQFAGHRDQARDRAWTSIRETKGSVASRSRTRTCAPPPPAGRAPSAARMCSITSRGSGTAAGVGPSARPCQRRSRRATSGGPDGRGIGRASAIRRPSGR